MGVLIILLFWGVLEALPSGGVSLQRTELLPIEKCESCSPLEQYTEEHLHSNTRKERDDKLHEIALKTHLTKRRRNILSLERYKRSRRNSGAADALFTSRNTAYLQVHKTHHLRCMSWRRGEILSSAFWFKGRDVIAKFVPPGSSRKNFTIDERYTLSDTLGLIIQDVTEDDQAVYDCRVVPLATPVERKGVVTVTVLDSNLPYVNVSTIKENGFTSVYLERKHPDHIIQCPISYTQGVTTYWSLDVGEGLDTEIIGSEYSNSAVMVFDKFKDDYEIDTRGVLVIRSLKRPQSRFWCHRFLTSVTIGYIDVIGTGSPPNGGIETKPNLALTALSIVLAFISLVCLITVVYLVACYLPEQRRKTKTDEEMMELQGEPDECTGLLLKSEESDCTDIVKDVMTQWVCKGIVPTQLDTDKDCGDIMGVVPSSKGGLVVATRSTIGVLSKHNNPKMISNKSDKYKDKVVSIAIHPQSDTVIVGLKNSSLLYHDVKGGDGKPFDSPKEFKSPIVAVDGAGATFVGYVKKLWLFDSHTKTEKEYSIDCQPRNITAYGWKHVFVRNGMNEIVKYNFKYGTKDSFDIFKMKDSIKIPDPQRDFGEIKVHEYRLYVVNDDKIFEYDVETFEMLQSFKTDFSDLRGMCFFGNSKNLALYSTNCVKVYTTTNVDENETEVST